MGCVFERVHRIKKSKKFDIEYAEELCNSRGVGIDKLYHKFPILLEAKRKQEDVDYITQCEVALFLNFPVGAFYFKKMDKFDTVIMCGSGMIPCVFCGQGADYYCDFPIGDGRTCDLALCKDHKKHRADIGIDIDYCLHHGSQPL